MNKLIYIYLPGNCLRKQSLTKLPFLNISGLLPFSMTSVGKPTPATRRFSFMKEIDARRMKETKRFTWMLFLGQ